MSQQVGGLGTVRAFDRSGGDASNIMEAPCLTQVDAHEQDGSALADVMVGKACAHRDWRYTRQEVNRRRPSVSAFAAE